MLDRIIGAFGMLFFFLGFLFCGVMFMGMAGKWYAVQDHAQFIASSEGKYGGYTAEANSTISQFCQDFKLNRAEVAVQVSAPNSPVPWGTPVWAKITVPYEFDVGGFMPSFSVPITGVGRSVSSYLPGAYSVSYTSP